MYKLTYNSPFGVISFIHDKNVLYEVILPGQRPAGCFSCEELDEAGFPQLEKQLEDYFNKREKTFTIELAFDGTSDFTREVLLELKKISLGELTTYKELSLKLKGKSYYSRAVGNAVGKNPLPLVIPCHRVVKTDGSLGGFSSGVELKRKILSFEGYRF
ncbi:methylated-DNA--[protein]-cysteine S-methyltransferase [Natranaerofaba carboxydovora]|uniref:methylated-DNA--[protein]-cysteine S-methyltransferase n=1 Tax=Natranaerofaba carboxydovora TaxID=2742683 RepID=UPI001F129AE7|nr:methylated-DNA--[protein]-cysteine S-methyltransferase [Natranaerofaba carboxydovora]UMZ73236.1 Methylated-DNA--protein-cysteine methyltransferase [Natranaerofaba carboxydovora]